MSAQPRIPPLTGSAEAAQAGSRPHGPASGHGPGTVLWIEDDLAYAELIRELLAEREGFALRVAVATTLADGLGQLRARDDIVCVLLDLNLPDARSLEAVEQLTADLTDPPVVVLTGTTDDAAAVTALRIGADDYLLKGEVDGERLERAIRYAMERQASRRELAERELFARSVLDAVGAQTAVIDDRGVIVATNDSWEAFAEVNDGDLGCCGVGANYLAVCDRAATEGLADAAAAARGIREVLSGARELYEQDYDCSTSWRDHWAIMRVTPLPPEVGGAVVMHTPITELKRTTAQLEHLAVHDALTGLPNRTFLHRRLQRLLVDEAGEGHVALLVCDLDDFKVVNDGLGHQAGDAVLIEVARRLREAVRPGDTVARLSGDEFVVLAEAPSAEAIDGLGERVRRTLSEPITLEGGEEIALGASVGITVAEDGDTAQTLLRDADAAMYRAKASGRGQVHWFDERLRSEVVERLELKRDLPAALEHGELECRHQPEVRLVAGTLFAVETLVRWRHPTRGLLSPGRFVPVFEAAGQAHQLFRQVLWATLATRARWFARVGWAPPVAVNVSATQLRGSQLVDLVTEAIAAHDVERGGLWLEVTESAVAEAQSLSTFHELHALGVPLAIDDFGTGWSSMDRLSQFPWDLLKIDRSFVRRLGSDPRAEHVVSATIAMAHALDITVVAEGVETELQRAHLADLGCDIAQGFLYGRPQEADALAERLSADGTWRGAGPMRPSSAPRGPR